MKYRENTSDGEGIRGSDCFKVEVMAASYGDLNP